MLTIRMGRAEDAALLARMIGDFNEEEGSPGRIDVAGVAELCFAPTSTYRVYIAEDGEGLVGYALAMRYFDTEACAWCSYMQDLYVLPNSRSLGIGRRLIAHVAKAAVDLGHAELAWHVRDRNERGRAFYAAIGGVEQVPISVTLSGDALKRLATEA